MRILTIDSMAMTRGFQELGCEVFHVGLQEDADITVTAPRHASKVFAEACSRGFLPDYVFWCDSGNLPFLPGIESIPCISAFYSVDTYCQHWHFGFANAFDVVFVAQKDHVELFPDNEMIVRWLPLFASYVCGAEESERDIPVSFVGTCGHPNNPDRESFLRQFKSRQPLVVYTGPYASIFSRSKIVLNQTACSEVNYRCFEAMACGAALLMEHCAHGMNELFVPGEHILPLYARNDWRTASAVARDALKEPEKLAEIAACGRNHVLANHMARHRAREALDVMNELSAANAVANRLEHLNYRRKFIAAAYAMLGMEIVGRLDDVYAEHYFLMSSQTSALRTAVGAKKESLVA